MADTEADEPTESDSGIDVPEPGPPFLAGVALGLGVGAALGVAIGDIAAGVALGIGLGVAFGVVWQTRR